MMPLLAPASITGAVLAGGRGARMGGLDKGWVPWQGRALIEHVVDRLRPQVGALWISANRNLDRYRSLGAEVVTDAAADLPGYEGPLAGMLAILERAPTDWVAFVPCDAPLLPRDLVARLAVASGAAAPAVACSGGALQPVFCLLPRALAPAWRAALARGERRPQEMLRRAGAVEVAFEDAAAFTNINETAPAPGAAHG
jgi:molybdopterin-guanine dinucleotide biosynthesis protein A